MEKWADEFRKGQDSAKLKGSGDAILRAFMVGFAILAAWFAPVHMWATVFIFFAVMFTIGIVVQFVEVNKKRKNPMSGMVITNFQVRRLTPAELELAKKLWADQEFIPTDQYWLATFEIDGVKHQAGIRRGRRVDVAEDIDQIDVQLRVREETFDADEFIPEAQVADIVNAVGIEFERGEYWKSG